MKSEIPVITNSTRKLKRARILIATASIVGWDLAFGGDLIVPEYSPNSQVAPTPAASNFSEREWQRLDLNKNGFITKREGRTMDPRSWTYADLNADGKISRKEWGAVSSIANKQGFNRAGRDEWPDLNRDGFVTRGEALHLDSASFARLDVDGDGRLSQKEWSLAGSLAPPGAAGRVAPLPPPPAKFE